VFHYVHNYNISILYVPLFTIKITSVTKIIKSEEILAQLTKLLLLCRVMFQFTCSLQQQLNCSGVFETPANIIRNAKLTNELLIKSHCCYTIVTVM